MRDPRSGSAGIDSRKLARLLSYEERAAGIADGPSRLLVFRKLVF